MIEGFRKEPQLKRQAPNLLGFQLANTWTKITARDVYAMVTNGKEQENP